MNVKACAFAVADSYFVKVRCTRPGEGPSIQQENEHGYSQFAQRASQQEGLLTLPARFRRGPDPGM